MEQPLFGLWERIVEKGSISIAVDGDSYQYDDEGLKYLSTLNLFEQFRVFYVTKRKLDSKE